MRNRKIVAFIMTLFIFTGIVGIFILCKNYPEMSLLVLAYGAIAGMLIMLFMLVFKEIENHLKKKHGDRR